MQSLTVAPAANAGEVKFSATDKQAIVQGFLSRAARLDAGDIHGQLTGVMGLVTAERNSTLLDFSLAGQNVGTVRDPFGHDQSPGPASGPSEPLHKSESDDDGFEGPDDTDMHDGGASFTSTGSTFRSRQMARPLDALFGLRRLEEPEERVYDLESARFALASELTGADAESLLKPMRFNFWLASKGGADFANPYDPGSVRRPEGWALSTGAHYKVTPQAMFGALFRARSTAGSAPGLSATTELESYGVGLYGGWALSDNITLSALGVYERGDNAATIDGASGRYGSDQLSLSANIKGYWRAGNWWLAPSASVTWNRTTSEAYVDSSGDAIGASMADTAQATFGPQVGYVYFGDEYIKAVRPRFALTGIYAFLDTGTKQLSGGAIPGAHGLYGQAMAGLDIWLNNRMTMNFDAGYDGIGAPDLDAWSVRGKVTIPFR